MACHSTISLLDLTFTLSLHIFSDVADAKSYVLISKLPADIYRKYVEDVDTAHVTGFTFVVVSIVHLAGGKIPEGMEYAILTPCM